MMQSSDTVRAPPSPTLAEIGSTARVLDGESVKRVRDLMATIFDQAGSSGWANAAGDFSQAMKQSFGSWLHCGHRSGCVNRPGAARERIPAPRR
jgi:hypothetical protein